MNTHRMVRGRDTFRRSSRFASRHLSAEAAGKTTALSSFPDSPARNVSKNIEEKIGRNLHLLPNHPLHLIKRRIEAYFASLDDRPDDLHAPYAFKDDLSPIVSVESNFDDLLVPSDHVSRASSDTFYVNEQTVLRTHTSAHQSELIRSGHRAFLCTGDVYRRDTVDATHYPIFHQMEGVRVFSGKEIDCDDRAVAVEKTAADLKRRLEGLVSCLFGDVDVRWVDAYFPFTDPSFEMEIYFQDEWLEVLGCGVIEQDILRHSGRGDEIGWAFGLGLERLAMVLYDIPDIRLFWSQDERFLSQFSAESDAAGTRFVPFSKFPPCLKDISFWVAPAFHENDLHDAARTVAGDLVENVNLIDEFRHPKTDRLSQCYRVTYRSMERNLTNEEIDALQTRLRAAVHDMGCELR